MTQILSDKLEALEKKLYSEPDAECEDPPGAVKQAYAACRDAKKLRGEDRALALVDAYFINKPRDEKCDAWILIALARCLKAAQHSGTLDKIKRRLHECEVYERYKTMNDQDLSSDETFDGLIVKGIRSLDFAGRLNEISDLSKSNPQEALAQLGHFLRSTELSEFDYQTAGWVVYRYLKAEDRSNLDKQVKVVYYYLRSFRNKRPSLVHSFILKQAISLSIRKAPGFVFSEFLEEWGWNAFMEEDYSPSEFNGRTYDALAKRAVEELEKSGASEDVLERAARVNPRLMQFLSVKKSGPQPEECFDDAPLDDGDLPF